METEILIIGAGAAGLAAAWNLSKSRYKIYCFDQGNIIKNKEFSSQHKNWEKLMYEKYNHNPNIRKMKSDYPIDNKNSPINISNFNSIGGSTILYSGHFLRFHPSDFKVKTLDKVGSDWPINYNDLEKYYELNEKNMNVAGLVGDKAYPKINKLSKPVELGILGETIANGFNKLGWHWWPSYSAVATKKYKDRKKGSITGITPEKGTIAYGSSKAAFMFASRVMANELSRYNIRVNAIAPSITNTKMLKKMDQKVLNRMKDENFLKKICEPDEIAELIIYLSSEKSKFINGQIIRLDGGTKF